MSHAKSSFYYTFAWFDTANINMIIFDRERTTMHSARPESHQFWGAPFYSPLWRKIVQAQFATTKKKQTVDRAWRSAYVILHVQLSRIYHSFWIANFAWAPYEMTGWLLMELWCRSYDQCTLFSRTEFRADKWFVTRFMVLWWHRHRMTFIVDQYLCLDDV